MALKIEESVKRRLAGMERAKTDTSATAKAQRIHRAMTTGRPPVSEMKTPLGAIMAAGKRHRQLQDLMKAEGLDAKYGVSIAWVEPDLSASSYTTLYSEDAKDSLFQQLDGKVPIGLLFGIHDPEPENYWRVRVGSIAFLNTKQIDEWFESLRKAFPLDMADPV